MTDVEKKQQFMVDFIEAKRVKWVIEQAGELKTASSALMLFVSGLCC
jgi:hypothetical protein